MNHQELLKTLEKNILFSLGLTEKQKEVILKQLPLFPFEKLKKLQKLFEQEKNLIEKILRDFFTDHKELFLPYKRFSEERISSMYKVAENHENKSIEQTTSSLLKAYPSL